MASDDQHNASIGPGPTVVRVAVSVDYNVTSIWNVIGRIEGAVEPDRLVLIGAHRCLHLSDY